MAPVGELRASVEIGSGSLSFEMTRELVERLPIMIALGWVSVAATRIKCSMAADEGVRTTVGIERRLVISVPLLTPRLSSLGLVWRNRFMSARILCASATPLTSGAWEP